MSQKKRPVKGVEVSPEIQERAKSLIRESFDLFTNLAKQLSDDFTAFAKNRERVRERIHRGARQTDGRIV